MQKKTAQSIAENASEIIGYGVLVTDEKGVIIGYSDIRRVGTMHEPSIDVMNGRRAVPTSREEAAHMEGVRPGHTCPIVISDAVVGTVSIAGPPEKVERYGLLVQKQAEIMLKEQNLLEMKLRKEQAVRDLAQSILLYRPEDENEGSLLLHGRELGYNLERCRVAVILDILSHTGGEEWVQKVALQQIRAFFQDPSHLISPLDNFRIALFPALRCGDEDGGMEDAAAALCRSLLDTLKESGIVAAAAVGTGATNLRELAESARSAREALRVGKIFKEENLHSARMLETERLLASVSRRRRTKHIAQVLLNLEKHDPGGELAKTFMTWCEASLSPKEVAEKLSIHRNTLQYRLKKIKEKTKLDPWNFHDSFVLWTALVLKMLENNGAFPEEG